MKSKFVYLVNLIFGLFVLAGLVFFIFWRAGILKIEPTLGSKFEEVKRQIDFVNNYPFDTVNNYIKDLQVQELTIPQVNPEEIGREKLF